MDELDLIPQTSTVFIPVANEEAKREEDNEKTMVVGSGGLIDHVIGLLDDHIKDADSITTLDPESKVGLEAQILGRRLASDNLLEVKQNLLSLKKTYIGEEDA